MPEVSHIEHPFAEQRDTPLANQRTLGDLLGAPRAPAAVITGAIKWGDANFAFAQLRRLRVHTPWPPRSNNMSVVHSQDRTETLNPALRPKCDHLVQAGCKAARARLSAVALE
jgi:hypothetical protein